jgi:hypothetical protein
MCEACFLKGIYQFASWPAFDLFDQQLLASDLLQQSRPRDEAAQASLSAYEPQHYYQCPKCEQVWALSVPDNAWRGYFLPERDALRYVKRLHRQDKVRRIGGGGVLLVLLLVLIWKLVR